MIPAGKFSISMSISIVDPSVKLDLCMRMVMVQGVIYLIRYLLHPVGGNVLIRIQDRANKHDISSESYLLGSLLKL